MASEFTLTQDENFNWQGATGATVTAKVVPKDTTLKLSIDQAYYPGTTALVVAGDTATFKVAAGPNDLTVFIKPKTVPAIAWSVVEVRTDKTTQTLATVNDPIPQGDPYSTAVRIVGQGSE